MSDNTTRSQDIGGRHNVYVPVFVDTSGQYRRLPANSIIDIAGVTSPNFTVDGRAIMFADGSASDGSGAIDFQTVYYHTQPVDGAAKFLLQPGKDFAICDAAGNSFVTVDAETGKITIHGEMAVISSIVKFTGSYQEFDHLNVLSNDGQKTSLLIEPKPGVVFQTDPVRIKSSSSGPIDFSINTQGQTYIRDLIVDNIDANLIDGVDFNSFTLHLSPDAAPYKHFGSEILYSPGFGDQSLVGFTGPVSVDTALDSLIGIFTDRINTISATVDLILQDESTETSFFQRIIDLETQVSNINGALVGIDSRLNNVEGSLQALTSVVNSINTANIAGINFEQYSPSLVWTIHHNTGSHFIQFTVYDETERLVWPDDAFALDNQTFIIVFSNLQRGRAILSCLIPPVTTLFDSGTPIGPPILS